MQESEKVKSKQFKKKREKKNKKIHQDQFFHETEETTESIHKQDSVAATEKTWTHIWNRSMERSTGTALLDWSISSCKCLFLGIANGCPLEI